MRRRKGLHFILTIVYRSPVLFTVLTGLIIMSIIKFPQRDRRRFAERNKATNIALLKVHKAGSTTIQNMLFRFGLRHNLSIILPETENYFNKQRWNVDGVDNFDIVACHTENKSIFDSLVPVSSIKIGIIRDPLKRLISAAYYYRDVWKTVYLKEIPKRNFIKSLVQHPEKYEKGFFSKTRNAMGKDFGFPEDIKSSEKYRIKSFLDKLNTEFLLVLSTERFDESLALLRRLLNWSFSDILYLKSNTHTHLSIRLNEEDTTKFRETSFLDYHLYEYFSKELDLKIKKQDSDFPLEVSFLQSTLEKVKTFCSGGSQETTLLIKETKWDDGFAVSKVECQWMQTDELEFIRKLRDIQTLTSES